MTNRSYSVLFMRDDADVKTLRVSPKRLKLLLWSALGLAIFVTLGLVVGLRSFVGYRSLQAERRDMEVKLAEAQVSLERLGNLDKLQHGGAAKGDKPAKAGAEDKAQPDKIKETDKGAAARIFARVNNGSIAVDNIRGQISGGNLNLSFDLNHKAQGSASGGITLFLLKNDGSLTELAVSNPADLSYQIQRYKRISASARLPEQTTRREALGLRMEIKNTDGELILGETYALGG